MLLPGEGTETDLVRGVVTEDWVERERDGEKDVR